jgi:hypothetical protein
VQRRVVVVAVTGLVVACLAACADDARAPIRAAAATPTTAATTTVAGDTGSLPPRQTADPYPDTPLIDHVLWTATSAGKQLRVFPTDAGRHDFFPDARPRAWQEVLTDAPDANTPGMQDQFYCHWDWARLVAPNKPSWNLEPWRPAVGYDATVRALCNPGGPEGN